MANFGTNSIRITNTSKILDPQRNYHYHHYYQNQNVGEEEEEEDEKNEPHFQIQLQQQQQQNFHFQQPNELLYQDLDTQQQPLLAQNPKKRSKFQSLSPKKQNFEHERPKRKLGMKNLGGEIVEVQGGHIVRSIGRKDRHSKVCTAKGPRDRRVRLSANTAIQFYDVQDRLGYDRPSKAVDWLIKKAKSAIDELEELPPWKPTIGPVANVKFCEEKMDKDENYGTQVSDVNLGSCSKRVESESGENRSGSFLPSSLDSDNIIADTIRSFFPMGGGLSEGCSSAMEFQAFQEPNLVSRTSSQSQDLRLSLQSFQEPIMLQQQNSPSNQGEQAQHTQFQGSSLFTGSTPLGFFDGLCWSEHQQQPVDLGRVQRLAAERSLGGGYLFNSQPPAPPLLQQFFGQNQFFSQRGPLQSSYSPSIRAWIDPSAIAIATADPIHHHQAVVPMYSASFPGIGFASEVGGFSGFRIPARIQGEIEEHDGISDKPSSASSDSRY